MDRSMEHLVSSDQAVIQVRRRLLGAVRNLLEGAGPPEAYNGEAYRVRSLDILLPRNESIAEGGREYMRAKV